MMSTRRFLLVLIAANLIWDAGLAESQETNGSQKNGDPGNTTQPTAPITAEAATDKAATDKAATDKAATDKAATDKAAIEALIDDLDANRFSQRQAASQKLKQLGTAAIPALIEAARGDSREAAIRAMEVLKEHFQQGEGVIKDEAKEALEKLTAAKKPAIARLANEALEPEPPQQQPPAFRPMPFGGGQIQIQFQAGGGGGRRVQMKTVNGVKETIITENNTTTKIVEDPNNGIQVEITEKVNGKEKTRTFKAKDAAELKKKHPEAHKAFEQNRQGGGIQLQIGPQNAFPFQINPPAVKPADKPLNRAEITRQLEKISNQLDETRKLLEELPNQDAQSLKKAIDQLEKAKQGLQDTQAKIQN